jgi:hypothetical protein
VIEGSSNLVNWTQVGTTTVGANGQAQFTVEAAGTHRIFRARVQ